MQAISSIGLMSDKSTMLLASFYERILWLHKAAEHEGESVDYATTVCHHSYYIIIRMGLSYLSIMLGPDISPQNLSP